MFDELSPNHGDHAWVIPASGKGSKGKGKHSWLCLFLAPDLPLRGCCHCSQSYHRLEADRHCPQKCAVTTAVPEGYWRSISSKILSTRQRVTNFSSFHVVMSYVLLWFICHLSKRCLPLESPVSWTQLFFLFLSTVKRRKPLWPLLMVSWQQRGQGKRQPWDHHKTIGLMTIINLIQTQKSWALLSSTGSYLSDTQGKVLEVGEGLTKVLGEAHQELTFACDFADWSLEHELARGASGILRSHRPLGKPSG